VNHHPYLYASRFGCWCHCACGTWKSRLYTTVTGAHYAFGQHLLAAGLAYLAEHTETR
jgi:hypothetical protein